MKSLQELLQPQSAEPDASIVEVFGSKSKEADDIMDYVYNLHGTIGPTPFHETAEGQEYALSIAEGLAFPGSAIGSIGKKILKGGAGRMFGSIPRGTKNIPRTQYGNPDFKPNPTGTFRNKQNVLVNIETSPKRLLRELESGDLDTFEFQEKLFELEQFDPELAAKVMRQFGAGGY